jgi:hypothetical protein
METKYTEQSTRRLRDKRIRKRAATVVTCTKGIRAVSGKDLLFKACSLWLMNLADDILSFYWDLLPFSCFEDD